MNLLMIGRVATLCCFLGVTYFALTPYATPGVDEIHDKSKHIFAFAVLMFGLRFFWGYPLVRSVAILIAYGVAIEIAQSMIPGRFPSFLDVISDAIGIGIGMSLSVFLERSIFGRICR